MVPKYAHWDYILANRLVELVANNLGIEDGGHLVLTSIFKFDWGWRLFNMTWDGAVFIGFEERIMKH